MSAPPTKVYLARAGRNGEDEGHALEKGVAIIGFHEYPSLVGAKDYKDIVEIVRRTTPSLRPRAVGNYAGQLWAFALAMEPGDTVVLPQKLTSQVALGRVKGPYRYEEVAGVRRHVRPVEWIRPDVPRVAFNQDLLNSFGAFLTVCRITRNDAEARVAAVLAGKPDPGRAGTPASDGVAPAPEPGSDEAAPMDLEQAARDQIVHHIERRFKGHDLARLVEAVLCAEGWQTMLSPPGPDGGADILGGRGSLGLDPPRLCAQVKSGCSAVDVGVFRELQGTMQSFHADQGLLVSWAGFTQPARKEARQGHFRIRLWESSDLVDAIYRTYDKLPAEIQAELPLQRAWLLVPEEEEGE